MRDLMVLSPARMFSVRKFFLFVATLVVTVFAFLLAGAPTAHAAAGEWKDGGIVYGGNTYTKYGDSLPKETADIPKGAQIYTYATEADKSATPPKINIIWFAQGADPKTAKTAHYAYYSQVGDAEFENPTKKATVTFEKTAEEAGAAAEETTSCVVEGIGWIVCPISTFLSSAMDALFKILQSFLIVQPIQADQENPLYRGWSIMRNFANVAFIAAFLIIIYSQITNIGLSSYGIKRLLPRVIIAAILVNISYWICAIAVDLSNIFGSSTYGILEGIRNDLVGPNDNVTSITWTDISGAVLSGGAAAGAAGVGIYAAAASAGGAIYLLLPILVGILLAALVAILILAARQAIITILVIIAPLAFVAYLLPNTEKLFDKWRSIFTTMLTLFPLFAGVIGGAQLAGEAIIQSALTMENASPNKLNLIIFGMAIKVAPVVVTPFLLKFSGSLLGRIAGVVNNPGKGLLDRTRNWSQGKSDEHKAKALANTNNPNFMARAAQGIDSRKRKREGWKKANETRADANWANSQTYRDIHGYDAKTSQIKEIGENAANTHVAQMRATDAAMQGLDINARASKLKLDVAQAKVDANWEEIKAGDTRNMVIPPHLEIDPHSSVPPSQVAVNALTAYAQTRQAQARSILETSVQATAEARRAHSARDQQQDHYAHSMIENATLQSQAGGIAGKLGADAALADAVKQKRKSYGEAVDDATQLMKHFNLSGQDRQDLAMGARDIQVKDTAGNVIKTFSKDSTYMREAAIEFQLAGGGSYKFIQQIMEASGGELKNYATTISAAIPQYKISDKAPFLGGKTIDAIGQGLIKNADDLNKYIASSIAGGKIKAEHLVTMDQDALETIASRVAGKSAQQLGLSDPDQITAFDTYMSQLGVGAQKALRDPRLNSRLAAGAEQHLQKLVQLYPPSPTPPTP